MLRLCADEPLSLLTNLDKNFVFKLFCIYSMLVIQVPTWSDIAINPFLTICLGSQFVPQLLVVKYFIVTGQPFAYTVSKRLSSNNKKPYSISGTKINTTKGRHEWIWIKKNRQMTERQTTSFSTVLHSFKSVLRRWVVDEQHTFSNWTKQIIILKSQNQNFR